MKQMFRVGVALLLLGCVIVPGAFWWWALYGMREPIGQAIGMTATILFIVGAFLVVSGVDL